jgi:hypothetical protein
MILENIDDLIQEVEVKDIVDNVRRFFDSSEMDRDIPRYILGTLKTPDLNFVNKIEKFFNREFSGSPVISSSFMLIPFTTAAITSILVALKLLTNKESKMLEVFEDAVTDLVKDLRYKDSRRMITMFREVYTTCVTDAKAKLGKEITEPDAITKVLDCYLVYLTGSTIAVIKDAKKLLPSGTKYKDIASLSERAKDNGQYDAFHLLSIYGNIIQTIFQKKPQLASKWLTQVNKEVKKNMV